MIECLWRLAGGTVMLLTGWQEIAAATCQPDHIRNALPGPLRPEIPNRKTFQLKMTTVPGRLEKRDGLTPERGF